MKRFHFGFIVIVTLISGCISSDLKPNEAIELVVMSTTDLHGWVLAWDYILDAPDLRYGMAKVATLVDSVRNVHPHTILLDAGDWLQGNNLADYYAKIGYNQPVYPLLQVADFMNYSAFVLGNHEFNYGIEYLNIRINQSKTPVLGANVFHHGTTNPAYRPYLIKNIRGVKVGILGLTTPGSIVWDRPRVSGRLDFGDGVETARRFVPELQKLGADVIIVLTHSGIGPGSSINDPDVPPENFVREIAETIPGIHLAVIGHTHRVTEGLYINGPDGFPVGIVQAGRWGSHLAISSVYLKKNNLGVIIIDSISTRAQSVEKVAEHTKVVNLVRDSHEMVRSFVNEKLSATTDIWDTKNARLAGNPVIDLIHLVQIRETGAQLSAASVFTTNARFGPGHITRKDVTSIYPYENMLYKIKITGKQLKDYLEFTSGYYLVSESPGMVRINSNWPGYNFDTVSGVDYEINLQNEPGSRLVNLKYHGVNVSDTDQFTIAVNSYRAEGGGGFSMIADAPVLWRSDITVREMIEKTLIELKEINHDDVYLSNWVFHY